MITLKQVKEARAPLREKLGEPEWLEGVGYTMVGESYALKVFVKTPEAVALVETSFGEIPVVAELLVSSDDD